MAKRMVLMLVAVAVFVGIVGWVKFRPRGDGGGAAGYRPPPEAVTTIVVKQEDWQGSLGAIGTVAAINGVTVSADLPGVVRRIAFESGDRVAAGTVLVELDTSQEKAQLAAAEAQLDLARLNLDRIRGLRQEGINSQTEYDTSIAQLKQAEGNVDEIKATIERKTIRAPFAGVLGLRQANLGQYLESGTPIVPLQSLDPIHVNFDVPQQEIGRLKAGGEVRVALEGAKDADVEGRIAAVDSVIDQSTRNVRAQAVLRNPKGVLHPGMFVTVRVILAAREAVVSVPASAVSYAPYGDSLFVVEEIKGENGQPSYKGVSQKFVKLGGARGDQVAVLSGLEAGAEVVTSGVFKLRDKAAVEVNNSVQPPNNPAPKPQDN